MNLQVDRDYYIENGRLVFTSFYLLGRGFCCGNGCRNCPYGAIENLREKDIDKKPEPD